ncbi:DUF5914 domain-containing protein [Nocardia abscessus]|uniref:DUF5914 domain-containing protein n=1 Tax=Nocardia abscessus TaxID=120957 RepID=UPI003CC7F30C
MSGRPGCRHAHRALPVLRPLMSRAATRLWRDELAYAERRNQQRSRRQEGPVGEQP